MSFRHFHATARVILAALLIGGVAVLDWRVEHPFAFAFLYLFPVLLVGTVWKPWQIVLAALVCTALADLFDPFPFSFSVSLPQGILVFTSLVGSGLFAYE